MSEGTKRNISVVKDADGNKIVVINDIIFKGKKIAWDDVEKYLRKYVGEVYSIAEDKEIVFIGTELPGEYAGSVYTKKLRGMNAKAKANAVQILPEMIEIASNGVFEHNRKQNMRAMRRWAGIGMIRDLHCQYIMIMGKWTDIISL